MGKIYSTEASKSVAYKKAYNVEGGKTVKYKKAYIVEGGKTVKLWSADNGRYVALAKDSSGWGIFITEDLTTWEKKCVLSAAPEYDSATNFFYLNGRYFVVYNSGIDASHLFYSDDDCETWTKGITSVTKNSNTYTMCKIKKVKDIIVGCAQRTNYSDYDQGCFGVTYDGVTWSYFTVSNVGLGSNYSTGCDNFSYHLWNDTDYFVIRTSYKSSPGYYLEHFPLSQLKDAYTSHSLGNYEMRTTIGSSSDWFVTGMLDMTPLGLTSQVCNYSSSNYTEHGLRGQTYNGTYNCFTNYNEITIPRGSDLMYAFKTNHTTTTEMYLLFENRDDVLKYYNFYNGVITGSYVPGAIEELRPLIYNPHDYKNEMRYGVYTDRSGTADGLKVGVVYNQTNVYKYGDTLTIIPTSLTFEGNLFEKVRD